MVMEAPILRILQTDSSFPKWFCCDSLSNCIVVGIPAISVPVALSSNGLPIGLQLLGRMFDESTMFSAAKWLQSEANCPALDLTQLDTLTQTWDSQNTDGKFSLKAEE